MAGFRMGKSGRGLTCFCRPSYPECRLHTTRDPADDWGVRPGLVKPVMKALCAQRSGSSVALPATQPDRTRMEWVRADDGHMATWTTVDNIIIDDDLSCRALGLLLRWLRRPPGVPIDTINQMIDRAKREGRNTIEGRDALYSASYELERAGYLVRELYTSPGGQHTWRVVVYARPVPPEKRSKPEDRARSEGGAGRKTAGRNMAPAHASGAPKPRKRAKSTKKGTSDTDAPVPGNPEPAPDASPIPGFPDSGFQEAFLKDSEENSLSSPPSSDGCGREQPSGGASGERDEKSSTTSRKTSASARKAPVRPVKSFPRPRASSETPEAQNGSQGPAEEIQYCEECWSEFTPPPGTGSVLCEDCR